MTTVSVHHTQKNIPAVISEMCKSQHLQWYEGEMHDHGDLHVQEGIIHVEVHIGILEMPSRQCLFVI